MTNDKEFKELEAMAEQAKDLEGLFYFWKRAHKIENGKSLLKTLPKCTGCGRYTQDVEKYKKNFIPDGVTSLAGNEDNHSSKVDVLFVLKEANTNGEYSAEENFWFNETTEKPQANDKNKMKSYNIRQSYANKFKTVLENLQMATTDKFGYMNLNKRGGYASATYSQLVEYTEKYKIFIRKQIEVHDPQYIIFCGCYDSIAKILFEKDKNGDDIEKWNKKTVVVNFNGNDITLYYVYHPSYNRFKESLSVFDK